MNSDDIVILGKKLEQDALADSLARLSEEYKNDVAWPEMPFRSEEQDKEYNAELQAALKAKEDRFCTAVSAAMRKAHEASRTQRDFEIVTAGRKKLMLGCLQAAAWRYEKLGMEIEAAEQSQTEATA